jgi:hypothetical protein
MICPAPAEPICRVTQAPVTGSMPAWAPLSIPDGGSLLRAPCEHRGPLTQTPGSAPPRIFGEAAPLGSTSREPLSHLGLSSGPDTRPDCAQGDVPALECTGVDMFRTALAEPMC